MPRSLQRLQKVLCGIDFSENSRAALRYAVALARRADGQVVAVFVNDPLLVKAAEVAYDARSIAERTAREFETFVTEAVAPDDVRLVERVVAVGDPAEELQKQARKRRTGVIVVGTRGLGGAGKLFFGSTTSRVLRAAAGPVLAVPLARGKNDAPDTQGRWPARILAGIALNRTALHATVAAVRTAKAFDARLVLLAVVPPVEAPKWLLGGTETNDRARLEEARKRLVGMTRKLRAGDADIRVALGRPADEITEAAVDTGADLILLRLESDKRWLGARKGSVTYRVLGEAQVPVLALTGKGLD
jgi:nucleotide-binding universal stress UspA family protein